MTTSLVLAFCVFSVAAALAPIMPRVNLSAAGPEVSRVALGILHLAKDEKVRSPADARKVLEAARAAGITTFDLADNYAGGKSLKWFGLALQALERDQPGWRASIQVIAKIGELDDGSYAAGGPLPWLDTGAQYTTNITDFYLKELNTTYLDVLMYHWPDRLSDPREVAATFKALKDSGKVRHFAVSNYKTFQFKLIAQETERLGITLVTNEVNLSPWMPAVYDDGTLEDAMLRGIRPLSWGPIGGDPSGGANYLFKVKFPAGSESAKRQTNIRTMLKLVGDELGETEDIVALAWTLRHPAGVVPIIGSMNTTRIALQARAPLVAMRMSRKQWWGIANIAGVLIWGGPVPFVPPQAEVSTQVQSIMLL